MFIDDFRVPIFKLEGLIVLAQTALYQSVNIHFYR